MINDKIKVMKQERNAKCACGSGLKYKKCCLKDDQQMLMSQRQQSQDWIKCVVGNDTLEGRIRQAEKAGADSLLDMTDDGMPMLYVKNNVTGSWEPMTEMMEKIYKEVKEELAA